MSGSITPTVPALPSALQNTQALLSAIASRTQTITDLNPGSIIRTIAESQAAVIEEQGAEVSSLVYQSIIYGAYTAFGISPLSGTSATGNITFITSLSGTPPPVSQNVLIPSGVILQTPGGVQFQTLNYVTLPSGSTNISVGISCLIPGTQGNVAASAISQIINGLSYPLYCANQAPTSGGTNSELPSQTAARFAATVALPGLASPLAVANAAIGVVASGTGEICYYATCLEPWISNPTASALGFSLYVDNGTGSASTSLLSAVSAKINSSPQYRPAGVPWNLYAAVPVTSSVSVSGVMNSQYDSISGTISGAIASGITSYYSSLQFNVPAVQGQIAASIGNAVPGVLSSLSVQLNGGASAVVASPSGRVILSSLSIGLQ